MTNDVIKGPRVRARKEGDGKRKSKSGKREGEIREGRIREGMKEGAYRQKPGELKL